MSESMKKAVYMARKAIENTYTGLCDVIEYHSGVDPKSKITKKSEAVVQTNIPCKLSYNRFGNTHPASPSDTISTVYQETKIFLAPEIEIKSGSKIVITQNGIVTAFKSSGAPSVYATHQEIPVELFKGWT